MTIERFKNILDRIEVPYEEVEVKKNNNIILKGFSIGNENLRPTIYEDMIEDFDDEVETIKFIERIRIKPGSTEEVFVKERFENSVYIGVRNKKWNDKDRNIFTFEVKGFSDLEGYYYLKLNKKDEIDLGIINNNEEYTTTKVSEALMKTMEIDENWLKLHAEKCMLAEMEIKGISQTLLEIIGDDLPFLEETTEEQLYGIDDFMYVVGKKDKHLGAGVLGSDLCFDKIKEFVAKKGYTKWAILPSSIHEILLVNISEEDKSEETLSNMVKEVNNETVEKKERLSDHAYIFN